MFEFDFQDWGAELTAVQTQILKSLNQDLRNIGITNLTVENAPDDAIPTRGRRNVMTDALANWGTPATTVKPTTTITQGTGVPEPSTQPPLARNTNPSRNLSPGISGPAFFLLENLKEAVRALPVTEAISLLQSLTRHATSLKPLMEKFKLGSQHVQPTNLPSIRMNGWFRGKYWADLLHFLNVWETSKASKQMQVLDTSTKENVLLKFTEGQKETDRLSFFHFLYGQMKEAVHQMIKIVQRLRNRTWPTELIDLNSLSPMFEELKKGDETMNITEGTFLSFANTHSLTYPVKDCDKPQCPLQIIMFIPNQENVDTFQEKKVYPLPIRHDGLLLNDWHRLTPSHHSFLYSPTKKIAMATYEGNCIPSIAEDMCSLCFLDETTRPPSDPCLKTLAQDEDPWEVCDYEKVRYPKDVAIKLDTHKWAYSDDTPGKLVETCGTGIRTIPLPTTGILTLNSTCEYQITDNPITTEELRSDQIIIQDISDYPFNNATESIIEKHIKDYYPLYIYGFGGTILLLITGWALSCYFRTCVIRLRFPTRRRRARRRQTREADLNTAIPLIAALTVPRPRIERGYRESIFP
jgi:hypothetical protein